MFQGLRTRFWWEIALASVSAGLGALTLATRDWIEVTFGVDPDRGSGSLEWLIVAAAIAVALTLAAAARVEWRRAAAQS
jgi:hypothetical protein